jgi:hypothetical protein
MTSRFLFLAGLSAIAAVGCARATFRDIDGGGGSGGSAGEGGRGGAAGDIAGQGGTGGGGGDVIGGNGGGGAGGGGTGGSTGGSIGGAGRGGSGATGGGGTGGGGTGGSTGGRGGTGGTAGAAGGTGGIGGTGGRGGTGVAGSGGTGGVAGTGGVGGTGGGPSGVMPTAAGQIVITELLHDVPGGDDNSEWFEIYNPSTTVTYNLMGCEVGDFNTYVPVTQPLVLPPGAFRTLGIVEDVGFKVDFVYGSTVKFDSQDHDSARVRCTGVLIDEFAYTMPDATDPNSVSHTYSVDPDHYSAVDNDLRANWCLGTTPYMMGALTLYGTPGAANPQCP